MADPQSQNSTPQHWIQVSVRGVTGELAEALCEVMGASSDRGAIVEAQTRDRTAEPDAPAGLDARFDVMAYLESNAAGRERATRLRESLWHLGRIRPFPPPEVHECGDQDASRIRRGTRSRIKPGRSIVVLPPWDGGRLAAGELGVVIEPGAAFGVGSHPSTGLCIALLEDLVRPGDRLLDVGCGTGILALAALRLGARHAVACDLDPAAIAATRLGARRGGVDDRLAIVRGSLESLTGQFECLVMNIVARVLLKLLPAARRRMAPGGRLILGGILVEEEEAMHEALAGEGLVPRARRRHEDWVVLAAHEQAP